MHVEEADLQYLQNYPGVRFRFTDSCSPGFGGEGTSEYYDVAEGSYRVQVYGSAFLLGSGYFYISDSMEVLSGNDYTITVVGRIWINYYYWWYDLGCSFDSVTIAQDN